MCLSNIQFIHHFKYTALLLIRESDDVDIQRVFQTTFIHTNLLIIHDDLSFLRRQNHVISSLATYSYTLTVILFV